MAKKKKRGMKKKARARLSKKAAGKVWGGLRACGRSLRASVAVLKNNKSSKTAKAKATRRLLGATKAMRKFQGLLKLPQRKWTGLVKKVVDKHAA